MAGKREDPLTQFNFVIEIDGVSTAGFSEVSGLTSDTNIIEYRNGSHPVGRVTKLPGLMKDGQVTLKRGYTQKGTELWAWRKKVIDGKTERTTISITLLDEARQPAMRWKLIECWPSKLEAPGLNGKTSEVAIETLEVAHEGLELES